MLLSKKLDPAVGQITKQPLNAVIEISEWIQHTWEYSSPIAFEVVIEVIARGVTLRRAELWKRIQRKEPKPDDVSDRTWRLLTRELDNLAAQKKSQNCKHANASHVNFRRTGPSGEVRVREKLRRKFRRFLEPHEVDFEMSRDKGYGGRSKRLRIEDTVMHGSQNAYASVCAEARTSNAKETFVEAQIEAQETYPIPKQPSIVIHHNIQSRSQASRSPKGLKAESSMSEDQILKNPLVLSLLEQIAALEAQQERANPERVNISAASKSGSGFQSGRTLSFDPESLPPRTPHTEVEDQRAGPSTSEPIHVCEFGTL
ncbi:hypothetical protein M758_UG225500 [Ceratodon purpureus]|nr:hypothetical protein M758_UG225500 [Ceratodon purpureus]